MSDYTLKFLQTELACFRSIEGSMRSPIDLELLQSMILQKQREGEEGSKSGSATQGRQYVDFLLPLPEHLQPTEIGLPDPSIIQDRRQESGLDNAASKASEKSRKELKARAELKQRLAAKPRYQPEPRPTRKVKIAPRPGGFSSSHEGE